MSTDDGIPAIDSRTGFHAALRWAFEAAWAADARRIVCVDPDFADWPWNDAALLDDLTTWLRRPQRRLLLLAQDFGTMPRRHPRFVAWRRSWVHAVEAFAPADDIVLPTLLLDDGEVFLRLADRVHWRGRTGRDRREAGQWRDEVDAVLQRSEPAFPAHSLGL